MDFDDSSLFVPEPDAFSNKSTGQAFGATSKAFNILEHKVILHIAEVFMIKSLL